MTTPPSAPTARQRPRRPRTFVPLAIAAWLVLEIWLLGVVAREIGGLGLLALLAAGLVLVSAYSGFPPFAVLAVLAGQLRMSLTLFLTVGLVGRWLRFATILGGAAWFGDWLR